MKEIFIVILVVLTGAFVFAVFGGHKSEHKPVRVIETTKPPGDSDTHGGLCVVCVGPHLNLSNGKIEMFSVGPGIQF